MSSLTNAEAKLREVKLLSVVQPENSDEAREALDRAFGGVKDAYSALPEPVRARLPEPRPSEVAEVSEHLQEAFWFELKARSATVAAIVVLALLLDLLPILLRFAAATRRTLDERVLDLRHSISRLRESARVPLTSQTEVVQVTVQDLPHLDIRITVPAAKGGPLVNIDRDFAQVCAEVRRERGLDVQLASVTTASGRPLLDDRALLMQLGNERELVVRYVPLDSFGDSFSEEEN